MSSFRSVSPGKKGGKWSGKLYFDSDASGKSDDTAGYYITDEKLQVTLKHLIRTDEKINHVWIYTTPLFKNQWSHVIMYHAYVVMETNTHWWSLEKNSENLVLQRSKTLEYVKDYCQGKKRNVLKNKSEPELWKHRESDFSLLQLFQNLWQKDELNSNFDLMMRNCQGFARRIFNSCSISKKKYPIDCFDPSELASKQTELKVIPLMGA
uniref:Uncharacterized protein n=1 Tax=Clytia hemisphaerica TaxID=252671 RepID=A0A7M6DNU9_9CNID|eukprot:TCONS_00020923-protein